MLDDNIDWNMKKVSRKKHSVLQHQFQKSGVFFFYRQRFKSRLLALSEQIVERAVSPQSLNQLREFVIIMFVIAWSGPKAQSLRGSIKGLNLFGSL